MIVTHTTFESRSPFLVPECSIFKVVVTCTHFFACLSTITEPRPYLCTFFSPPPQWGDWI